MSVYVCVFLFFAFSFFSINESQDLVIDSPHELMQFYNSNILYICKPQCDSEMWVVGHGKKLEESIISETSGHLKRLLVALLQANRPEGNTIDRRKARNDAKAMFEAGEKKFGTDESRFNVILCSRFVSNYLHSFLISTVQNMTKTWK